MRASQNISIHALVPLQVQAPGPSAATHCPLLRGATLSSPFSFLSAPTAPAGPLESFLPPSQAPTFQGPPPRLVATAPPTSSTNNSINGVGFPILSHGFSDSWIQASWVQKFRQFWGPLEETTKLHIQIRYKGHLE